MISRDRVKLTLNHIEPDRVPLLDIPWDKTVERWHKEGIPFNIEIEDYFGYELKWFLPDISLQFPYKVIEETDKYIIERNNYGEVVKNFKDRSSTPQIMESPIKNKSDWDKLKNRLKLNEKRGLTFGSVLDYSNVVSFEDGLLKFKKYYDNGKFILFGALVGFDLIQRYVGMERLLMAIVTDPEWVKEMFLENAKFIPEMYEYMESKGYKFDGIFIFDDLGYRNTSLFSPLHYKKLLLEADKIICDYAKSRNLKVILHSDGCVKDLIPYFIEAGIDCLQPLEVKAGMDLIDLKKKYGGKLSFMGGIDTRLYYNEDVRLFEEEVRKKFEVVKKGGGFIYQCDHTVPPNVSLNRYKDILKIVKKYSNY